MSKISLEIGKRIRNYRNGLCISQEELAEKCGLHPTYIGQLERGEKNATLESIEKVASGLSVSLSRLFENIGEDGCNINYPKEAYLLVQSANENEQRQLIGILKEIIEYKKISE
ncbi:MAG: helix-turn-helix domain-containing protein [Huintestinicola sp.]